jgi:hypothetical protein
MSGDRSRVTSGYVDRFLLTKRFDDDRVKFDLELVLADQWSEDSAKTIMHFHDVRDLHYGSGDPISFGDRLALAIVDVSADQWEGVRFTMLKADTHYRSAVGMCASKHLFRQSADAVT